MVGERVIYFGFIVLFLSLLLFLIALLLVQPVKMDVEVDIEGRAGDITTIANSDYEVPIPKVLNITNPMNGKTTVFDTELKIPTVMINSSLSHFNATAHVKGQIEVPMYVLAYIAYSRPDKLMNFSIEDYVKTYE